MPEQIPVAPGAVAPATDADGWDVPILAHPLEVPYLDGSAAYPPPDPYEGRDVRAGAGRRRVGPCLRVAERVRGAGQGRRWTQRPAT
jgi:hypothetical protein